MYECYSAKRFLRLVMLDFIIFSLCFILFFIGKNIVFSASNTDASGEIFLPVIMYHSIHNKAEGGYEITPEQLEDDLAYLKQNGYISVSAQQLVNYVYYGADLPPKPVLITLDDGFYNNLYYLLPLLEKYDMNAIVSVVGSYIDNDTAHHVPELSYLTWKDINMLIDSGRVEIGNHTYNMHSDSGYEYAEDFSEDIALLQSEIHRNTGTTPFVFSYPCGFINDKSLSLLKENGFLVTLTGYEKPNYISRNPDCLFDLNRYNRSGEYSTEEFMQKALSE